MIDDWRKGGFGIYVHWPFCEAKCPYCDFNSYVAKSIDQARWKDAYLKELKRFAAQTPDRIVRSVFFGGGTPSLMAPETVSDILDTVSRLWPIANDVEVTLEANPSSVEAGRFQAYRTAGVNRVSMGVQALNDQDLHRLGRVHSVAEARAAMDVAQTCFDRASFDLIYARQDQTLEDWEKELKRALTFGFSHFSLYQLTIEEGTAFGDRYKRGRLGGLPSDDNAADMYDATLEICEAAGLPYYEVSNFAAPGEESRHNQIYWRYGDYVGIGPGAHGRLTDARGAKWAIETELNPGKWLSRVEQGLNQGSAVSLSAQDCGAEFLLMGLRLREGIDSKRFFDVSGMHLPEEELQDLINNRILQSEDGQLSVSKQYVSVLNAVIERLLPA